MNVLSLIAALDEAVSPARLQLMARQFNLTPEQIETAAAADPTGGKYLAWICKLWAGGKIRLPEDAGKLQERLTQFAKLSRTSTWTGPKDIGQFQSYADLARAVEAAAPGKKELVRIKAEDGVEFLAEKGHFKLYKVTTSEAGAKLFRHTEWCVKDPAFFNSPDYGPPFYYLTSSELEDDAPYQLLHIGEGEVMCMDVMDDPVPVTAFESVGLDVVGLVLKRGSAATAANFAHDHLKRRWPEAEGLIATDPWAAVGYVRVLKGRFPAAEPSILSVGAERIHSYLLLLKRHADNPPWPEWRWPEGEAKILGDLDRGLGVEYSIRYAVDILKGPWPEAEPHYLNARAISLYTEEVAGYVRATGRGPWPEFEAILLSKFNEPVHVTHSDFNAAITYATEIHPSAHFSGKLQAAFTTQLEAELSGVPGVGKAGIGPLVRLFRDVLCRPYDQARAEAERIEAGIEAGRGQERFMPNLPNSLAQRLLAEEEPHPTQPKSPKVIAKQWDRQHYPGKGPKDPDTFYPRKNPKHVLGQRKP